MAVKESSCGVIPVQERGGVWMLFLIKHAAGHWGLPKGKQESDESVRDCAARELKEETSLLIDHWFVARPFYEEYSFERDGEIVEKSVIYCLAQVKGAPKVDQKEVIEGRWVSFESAVKLITHEESRQVVQKAKSTLALVKRLNW